MAVHFAAFWSGCKILACEVRACRFGFKSHTAVLTFTFRFLASFFFFCWAFSRRHFKGKDFRQAFRILELHERKGRWVVEQDVHGNFQVYVTWFFAFFLGALDWIVLIVVWFERSLQSAQVSGQSCPWPLTLISIQAVEGTCIRTGGSGANGLINQEKNAVTYLQAVGDWHAGRV